MPPATALSRPDAAWLVAGTPLIAVLDGSGQPLWSLDLRSCPGLTPEQRGWHAWYHGACGEARLRGSEILATAVSGAVVRIDAASGAVRLAAWLPGAHAVEALPGGLLAVAVSAHPVPAPGMEVGLGHRVVLVGPAGQLDSVPLPEAHGVVWDAARSSLWALGDRELLRLIVEDGKLQVRDRICTPGQRGHDLVADTSDGLWCSFQGRRNDGADAGAWRFDRANGWWEDGEPALAGQRLIKSIAPTAAGLAWVAAEHGHTATRIATPQGAVFTPCPVYKARALTRT